MFIVCLMGRFAQNYKKIYFKIIKGCALVMGCILLKIF